jgi:hypothetical protein
MTSGLSQRGATELRSRLNGELIDQLRVGSLGGGEHRHLQLRAVHAVGDLLLGDRLDDVMDVNGLTARMRPQAHVGLGRGQQRVDDRGAAVDEQSLRRRLGSCEVRDPRNVSDGLEQEGPDAERADAVLDAPAFSVEDHAARKRLTARSEIARKAPDDVHSSTVARKRISARATASLQTSATSPLGHSSSQCCFSRGAAASS